MKSVKKIVINEDNKGDIDLLKGEVVKSPPPALPGDLDVFNHQSARGLQAMVGVGVGSSAPSHQEIDTTAFLFTKC